MVPGAFGKILVFCAKSRFIAQIILFSSSIMCDFKSSDLSFVISKKKKAENSVYLILTGHDFLLFRGKTPGMKPMVDHAHAVLSYAASRLLMHVLSKANSFRLLLH